MIFLASTSLRRIELLKSLGVDFKAIKPNYQEVHMSGLSASLQVQQLAFNKALSVKLQPNDIVISGDTIVEFENEILEKPVDQEDAIKMLQKLNGQTHRVVSAICVLTTFKSVTKSFVSEVTMKHVSMDTLKQYVLECQPLDKAGSYGIQDAYFKEYMLEEYTGLLNTIIGFPIEELKQLLKEVKDDSTI